LEISVVINILRNVKRKKNMKNLIVFLIISVFLSCENNTNIENTNSQDELAAVIDNHKNNVENELQDYEVKSKNPNRFGFTIGSLNTKNNISWSNENVKNRVHLLTKLDLLNQGYLVDLNDFEIAIDPNDSMSGMLLSKGECNLTGLYISYGIRFHIENNLKDGDDNNQTNIIIIGEDSCSCSSECALGCTVDPAVFPCGCTPCSSADVGKPCKKVHVVNG
jgi:hypothetical protein